MNTMYRLLYVEDQNASSIEDDLTRQGFDVKVDDSNDFNKLFDIISQESFDAYILDFRLTKNKGRLDAPAIAQAMRTKGDNYKRSPIILVSNEDYLKEFDKDLTSQDLFDFAISKEKFRIEIGKYSDRIKSFIDAYKIILRSSFRLENVLDLDSASLKALIDSRFIEKIKSERVVDDTFAYCRLINMLLMRSIGPLIGSDVLAARLGVDKESQDWPKLLALIDGYKYSGILSDIYERWWMELVILWWKDSFNGVSLRRLKAEERVSLLSEKFNLTLTPTTPQECSTSSEFWTICVETKHAIDPNEGYIVHKKDYFPWQEMEYLSLYAALRHSNYRKYISSIDRKEIREIEKNDTGAF